MNSQKYAPPSLSKHLRIGIDGRPLQGNRRGDGRYIFELCREIDKCLPNARFFVYSSIPLEMPVLSDRWVLRTDLLFFNTSSSVMVKASWMGFFPERSSGCILGDKCIFAKTAQHREKSCYRA
jgi:hypothetical protein